MRILIVGAGATGGYFGGRLAAAGRDVTFLVRPGRAGTLRERGLRIKGPDGEAWVERPRTITADTVDGPYDLILLAVKSYALEQALLDLAPAVGPRTVVVPLLNGMRHVDELLGAFGPERAWGAICMIHASLDADGDVVQATGLHRLDFGTLDGSADARIPAVTETLSGAGFDSQASATIVWDMWEKWVFLSCLGAATTLMRAPVGEINAAPGGADLGARIAAEAIAIATAAGYPPRPGAVALLQAGIESTAPMTSSLYRDMMQGRPVEADAIIGDFVSEAGKYDVPAPMFGAAYTNLSIYQARRAG
ncbi:ketopantoate reductase family protein [Paractinoplanes rishiriensis]|uniref:2-dehydropantoate 2-reductase n=1 Tax=Paractinoplanes rishiriensis TaxID=1050105 RepID=A0A919MYQ2_9ACTN|nr:ketopantoate reductase family protein [Actinoplanes rishiriensis]GIE92797.1 2-dehydropantoate 2-reductase [Actinoplanes rishiriensis]